MKFECPQCGKKYSLPNNKVPVGKDFKVKCKKCGEVIILHSETSKTAEAAPQQAAAPEAGAASPFTSGNMERPFEEEPTRVFDYSKAPEGQFDYSGQPNSAAMAPDMGLPPQEPAPPVQESFAEGAPAAGYADEPEWHIAVDGEQMGPYAASQINEMLAAQQIDIETYLWKDGFDDWLPIKDIPYFQGVAMQVPAAAPEAGMPAGDFQTQTEGAKGSLFSKAFSPQAGIAYEPGASAMGAHDLFSPQAADEEGASPFESGGAQDVVTSSPAIPGQPRVDAAQLKGARHDDSVLFSLGSLQALASSSKEPARAVSTSTEEGGSGLIDIRSLAGGAATQTPSTAAKSEDIFSMGGGGFGQPMGIPSLLQPQEEKSNTLLYVLGGVGGFAVLAIIVLVMGVFVLGWGRPSVDEASMQPTVDEEELKAKLLAELQKGMEKEKKQGEEKVLAANETEGKKAEGNTSKGETEDGSTGTTKKKGGKKKKGSDTDSDSSNPPSITSSKEPGTKTGSKSGDSLLALIDKATSKKKKDSGKTASKEGKTASTTPAASLPNTPSKNDVLKAMKKVTGKVKACAKGQTGKAVTSIIFSGSTGKATSAKVIGGEFKGTPAAGCIAKAAKSSSVPKFKQKSFSVTYPFVVK